MTLPSGSLSRPGSRRPGVRARLARAALGLLTLVGVALGIAALASAAHAQTGPLADSTAWEPLGSPLQVESFGFTGEPETPLVWAVGQATYTLDTAAGVAGPWTRISRRPLNGPILFYGPDPAAPDTVFGGSPLYRSVDGGRTFYGVETPADLGGSSRVDGPGIDRLPAGAPHAHRLVAGDDLGLLYSDDGGDTWAAADTTPPLLAFSIKALRSGRVIAGGFYGAVLSDDGGQTWRHVPDLYAPGRIAFDVQKITVLPGYVTGREGDSEEGRVLLTGTSNGPDGGWYQWWSDDEGATWSRSVQPGDTGCGEGVDLVPLVAETGQPGDVLAVTCVGAVLRSEDGGETWGPVGRVPGISSEANTSVNVATLGPDGRLYVGTAYAGPSDVHSYRTRWRASAGFAVAVADEPGEGRPELGARPNPARELVELALSDRQLDKSPVELVVVDGLGREVARRASASRWRLDVSGWAPGVYRARVVGNRGRDRQPGGVVFTIVR